MAVVFESMQLLSIREMRHRDFAVFGDFNLHSAVDLGQVAVRNVLRSLVADTKLEASRAPVDELDGALGLESSDSGVGVVGNDVTSVQKAGSHVLAKTGVTLDHLVVRLEAGHGDLHDRVGLVGSLGSRDDGSIGDQREVDSGVRNQVGLELVQINIERAIETQRGSDGRNDCTRNKLVTAPRSKQEQTVKVAPTPEKDKGRNSP